MYNICISSYISESNFKLIPAKILLSCVISVAPKITDPINGLSLQKEALKGFNKFSIVDDLLATGGTAKCVAEILKEAKKEILGLSVVVELGELNGKSKLDFPMISQVIL